MRMVLAYMRRWARRWFSREIYLLRCERCGTLTGTREHTLPASGQLVCLTCGMPTFHKRVYYDHEDTRFRELGS